MSTTQKRFAGKSNRWTKEIRAILDSATRDDKSSFAVGCKLASLIDSAMFYGAKTDEFRGISNCGLTRIELRTIAIEFSLPDGTFGRIVDCLDS